jgi:hypothetical protein
VKSIIRDNLDDPTEGLTIESILDPTYTKAGSSKYRLTLRIKYQTNLGESLCVVGDVEELGNWKTFNCQMTWTEGHIWVLKDLLVTSKSHFNYKYVLMEGDKPSTWEAGHNRLADLRKLPVVESGPLFDMFNERKGDGSATSVEIFDVW